MFSREFGLVAAVDPDQNKQKLQSDGMSVLVKYQ